MGGAKLAGIPDVRLRAAVSLAGISQMRRRRLSIVLNILLVVLAALLGLASDYLANATGAPPPAFRLLQRWTLPLAGLTLALIIGVQLWLYVLERPASPKRVWDSNRPPYPGLEAFIEEDAGVFFGRQPQIDALLERLHPIVSNRARRFVAVVGPSGAGKSSLVQAGLLPRLAQRRSRWVIVPPIVPGDEPMKGLADSLAAAVPGAEAEALMTKFAGGPAALAPCIERLRAAHGGPAAPVLLVIDQAEELLTLTGEQQRLEFLALLRAALRHDPRLWAVAALRSEFLTGMLQAGAADLFANPLAIGPLDRAALFEVVEKPAEQASLTFAPGVVNELVDDTGSGDALPLLAYTLQALYLRAGSGGTITAEDYRRLGGVAGTLARQADQAAAELKAADADAPVLSTLLRFVTVDGTEPTRRRVRRGALDNAERQVVNAFVTARLLTSDAAGDDAVVEVAHEALFRQWPPLRQSIEAAGDELRQRAELERWAQDWLRSGRKDSYLLRAERLESAQQWATTNGNLAQELPLVSEFLDRSSRSDHASLERLSEATARRALASIESDPEQGILLAVAAIQHGASTPLAYQALLAALAASRVHCLLRGHQDEVNGVAWSPDGLHLATASSDRTARIWDAASGVELTILQGHQDEVQGVAWSPDGRHLASASRDSSVRIWTVASGTELTVLHGHGDALRDVAWSPDGRSLMTGSHDSTARIWDTATGMEMATLRGHQNWVEAGAWSPDGRRLATASHDHTARLWDTASGTELAVLRGHQRAVRDIAWSPDGRQLATVSGDGTVRIWDSATGTEVAILSGHQDAVGGVAWSPDGRHLATASNDRTARIWNAGSGIGAGVLHGHEDAVRDAAWSPDGQRLATASHDRTARIWDPDAGTEVVVMRGHLDLGPRGGLVA